MIYGIVKGQRLDLRAVAVADTIDYLTASFSFMSADWDGMTKFAHFAQGETVYSVELTDDKVTADNHLNLAAGQWSVYLHGNIYEDGEVVQRITTNVCEFTVDETGTLEGEPFPEAEPSIVEQLRAEIAQTEAEIADIQTEVEKIDDKAEVFDLNVDNQTMQRRASVLYDLYLSHTKVFKYNGDLVIGAIYDGSTVFFYYQLSSGTNAGNIYRIGINSQGMYMHDAIPKGNIHLHENKSVIDKFSDDGGLLYDGEPIASDLTPEEMVQVTAALVDYVTINGAYFGTDGENIIAF